MLSSLTITIAMARWRIKFYKDEPRGSAQLIRRVDSYISQPAGEYTYIKILQHAEHLCHLISCACTLVSRTPAGELSDTNHSIRSGPDKHGPSQQSCTVLKQSPSAGPISDQRVGLRLELQMLLRHSSLWDRCDALHQPAAAKSMGGIKAETVNSKDVFAWPLWKGGCTGAYLTCSWGGRMWLALNSWLAYSKFSDVVYLMWLVLLMTSNPSTH